jgi:hypothetical protein
MPGVDIPLSKMNRDLHLYAPPEANLFKIGSDFAIVIENLSENPIIISASEVSVFEKMESEWKKIEKTDQFPNKNFQVLPKSEEILGGKMLSIIPDLKSLTTTTLRVIVIGNIVKDDHISNQRTAGYIDLTMNP